jgi:hypothetical protein
MYGPHLKGHSLSWGTSVAVVRMLAAKVLLNALQSTGMRVLTVLHCKYSISHMILVSSFVIVQSQPVVTVGSRWYVRHPTHSTARECSRRGPPVSGPCQRLSCCLGRLASWAISSTEGGGGPTHACVGGRPKSGVWSCYVLESTGVDPPCYYQYL